MSFGFNSNVRVGEIVYHVQTEQRGKDAAVIDTVVYLSGRVIHRLKTPVVGGQVSGASDTQRAGNDESQPRIPPLRPVPLRRHCPPRSPRPLQSQSP
jgi:hypothetical protein